MSKSQYHGWQQQQIDLAWMHIQALDLRWSMAFNVFRVDSFMYFI